MSNRLCIRERIDIASSSGTSKAVSPFTRRQGPCVIDLQPRYAALYGTLEEIANDSLLQKTFFDYHLVRGISLQSAMMIFNGYITPIARLSKEFCHMAAESPITLIIGDHCHAEEYCCIAKSRAIGDVNTTLLPLNNERHWSFYNNLVYDIDFLLKRPAIIFRGATTGLWDDPIMNGAPSARRALIECWNKHSHSTSEDCLIDIGISSFVQGVDPSKYKSIFKGPKTISEILEYRYIICLEGNDASSILPLVLASNSVPIMPRPTVETWLLHSRLQEWTHYIPIDLTNFDLEETLRWCEMNHDAVAAIAENGRKYIQSFMSQSIERLIERIVFAKAIDADKEFLSSLRCKILARLRSQ